MLCLVLQRWPAGQSAQDRERGHKPDLEQGRLPRQGGGGGGTCTLEDPLQLTWKWSFFSKAERRSKRGWSQRLLY